jgi:hypothetical protein
MNSSNKKLKKYAGLLNDAAPKGEFLAFINPQESELLKRNGALGLLTDFGIPSYRGDDAYGGGGSSSSSSSSGGGGGGGSGGGSSGGGGGGGGRDYSPPSKPSTPSAPSGGGDARESYGAGGQYQQTTTPSTPSVSVGGGQDMSSVPVSTSSIGNGNDARLDYITGEYLDLNLTPEQKEQFSDYREGVSEAISPSTKTSNKIISGLLSATLFPFAGNLYNAYIDATAMGYSVPNPFEGLFGSGNITPESIQNFQDQGGGGDGGGGQVSTPVAPVAPSNNLPSSMVNQYFNNLGTSSQSPLSSSLETSYNAAKANINNLLGITPPSQQFGYSAQPYGLLSSTNVTSNPFNIDYLKRLGLI